MIKGKIHKINRNQNVLLYEHFNMRKKTNYEIQLKDIFVQISMESRGMHILVVYSGESVAFKINFSKVLYYFK